MSTLTDTLRSKIRNLELASQVDAPALHYTATPFAELNAILPGGGLPRGALTEILCEEGSGRGAFELALTLAGRAFLERPVWLVIEAGDCHEREPSFYPATPVLDDSARERLIHVKAPPKRGAWAFTQALRCSEVSVALFATRSMDNLQQRRFQLAAQRGGTIGIVLRPLAARRRACWAALRLKVEAAAGQDRTLRERAYHVEVLTAKGGEPLRIADFTTEHTESTESTEGISSGSM